MGYKECANLVDLKKCKTEIKPGSDGCPICAKVGDSCIGALAVPLSIFDHNWNKNETFSHWKKTIFVSLNLTSCRKFYFIILFSASVFLK